MRSGNSRGLIALLVVALWAGLSANPAQATFHEWTIHEVYSDSTGKVQFIEFYLPYATDNESFLTFANLSDSAFGHSYAFPSNLPSVPVVGQYFLVGTQGYSDLTNSTSLPAPDYVIPNNFLSTGPDTLLYAGGLSSLSWSSLPTDGMNARYADGSTSSNSVTNFSNQSGSVSIPEPTSIGLLGLGIGVALLGGRTRRPR